MESLSVSKQTEISENIDGCAKEDIDAAGCIIMPGLVNTHTHLPMVCFRGMADDLPLMDWLQSPHFPGGSALRQ